ncbi:MAG TPA: hypothetical protein VF581_07735 [Flavobacterium sp.]|jgi:hypothetical protein
MPDKVITVKLHIDADTPFRLKDKEALLKRISNLAADDQQRIIQICDSPKALQSLAENWQMLQSLFK